MNFRPTVSATLASLVLAGLASAAVSQEEPRLPERHDLQALDLPSDPSIPFTVRVELDGQPRMLELQSHSIRAAGYQLATTGVDGLRFLEANAPTTFRGTIAGEAGSRVAGRLGDGALRALIWTEGDDDPWVVQPLRDLDVGVAGDLHVAYRSSDAPASSSPLGCGVLGGELPQWIPTSASSGTVKVCEIAIECDTEYYQANGGSLAQTEADVEGLINLVSAVYETQLGIRLALTFVHVWTAEPDPYPAVPQDGEAGATAFLLQFKNYWDSNFAFVQRDVAHLFTKNSKHYGYSGYAFFSVCGPLAYAWDRPFNSSSISGRTGIVAHELGHNFGALHCQGEPDCGIMNGNVQVPANTLPLFGSSAVNSITSSAAGATCLDDGLASVAPTLAGIIPGQIAALGGDATLTGSGLGQVLSLTVQGQELSLWSGDFQILDDSTITFTPPPATALGSASVTATNPGGMSNVVSFDYVETSPPALVTADFILETSTPSNPVFNTWTWGGLIGDSAELRIAFDPTTATLAGVEVLSNPVSQLPSIIPAPVGIDSYTRIIPPSLDGLDLWSQVLVWDAAGNLSASPIRRTCIGVFNPCQ